jgi:hypothetical protein
VHSCWRGSCRRSVVPNVVYATLYTRAAKKCKELRRKDERRERARRVREEKVRKDVAFTVQSPSYPLPSSLSDGWLIHTYHGRGAYESLRRTGAKSVQHAEFRGQHVLYRLKFDPEVPTGKTLIMPVFFLYPEHASSDTVLEFVKDTS